MCLWLQILDLQDHHGSWHHSSWQDSMGRQESPSCSLCWQRGVSGSICPPPRSGLALLVRSGHALSKQKPWGEGGGLPCGRSEHPCCWWLLQLWGHWPSPQLLWPSTWSSPFPPAEPHIHQKPLVGSRAVPHGLLAPRGGSGATFSTSAEGCSVTDGLSSDTSQSLQSSPPLLLPLQPAELSVPPLLMLAAMR